MADLYLIRHGETDWSRTGRHTSHTDLPLTATGLLQAEALSDHLKNRSFALVLTSPLTRARETARLAGYASALVEPNLHEWDYGQYEGRTTAEIQRECPGWSLWTGELPGGETAAQVAGRVDAVIARAQSVDGDVALFAHGHILRVLAARWLGLPPHQGRLFALHTATISVLGHEHAARVITRWNLSASA
ncbi:MAG: histidine phosphatase family protein [Candidatus Solibacter sp.]